jgi:hypothetical protein
VKVATRHRVNVTQLPDSTVQGLTGSFSSARERGLPYGAWHHVGHGGIDEETGAFVLLLRSEDGREERVPADRLVREVARAGVRCAVINLCHGGSARGLATALAGENMPIVVGHRTQIYDAACISFAATLWSELARGMPAELAVRTARMSIISRGLGSHWALPMLFARVDDTRLIAETGE